MLFEELPPELVLGIIEALVFDYIDDIVACCDQSVRPWDPIATFSLLSSDFKHLVTRCTAELFDNATLSEPFQFGSADVSLNRLLSLLHHTAMQADLDNGPEISVLAQAGPFLATYYWHIRWRGTINQYSDKAKNMREVRTGGWNRFVQAHERYDHLVLKNFLAIQSPKSRAHLAEYVITDVVLGLPLTVMFAGLESTLGVLSSMDVLPVFRCISSLQCAVNLAERWSCKELATEEYLRAFINGLELPKAMFDDAEESKRALERALDPILKRENMTRLLPQLMQAVGLAYPMRLVCDINSGDAEPAKTQARMVLDRCKNDSDYWKT